MQTYILDLPKPIYIGNMKLNPSLPFIIYDSLPRNYSSCSNKSILTQAPGAKKSEFSENV